MKDKYHQLGNECFKNGDYKGSIDAYSQSLLIKESPIVFSNRAECNIRLSCFKEAVEDCTKALILDNSLIKAYFRRAKAYEAMSLFDSCLNDLRNILSIQPDHYEAKDYARRIAPKLVNGSNSRKLELARASIDLLISKRSTDISKDIKMVMYAFDSDPSTRSTILNTGFATFLMNQFDICFEEPILLIISRALRTIQISKPDITKLIVDGTIPIMRIYRAENISIPLAYELCKLLTIVLEQTTASSSVRKSVLEILVSKLPTVEQNMDDAPLWTVIFAAIAAMSKSGLEGLKIAREIALVPLLICRITENEGDYLLAALAALFDDLAHDKDPELQKADSIFAESCGALLDSLFSYETPENDYMAILALSRILQSSTKQGIEIAKRNNAFDNVLAMSINADSMNQQVIVECMAMCASDAKLRADIIDSGQVKLLIKGVTTASSDRLRAHTAVILSKLSVQEDSIRAAFLTDNTIIESIVKISENSQDLSIHRFVVESLVFLSYHKEIRLQLISNDGKLIKSILKLSTTGDRTLNYALTQLLVQMCLSSGDLEFQESQGAEGLTEMRTLADKALGKTEQETKTRKAIMKLAGSAQEVAPIRSALVRFGSIKALGEVLKSLDVGKISPRLLENVSYSLFLTAQDIDVRGHMVAQSAIRLLVSLFSYSEISEHGKEWAGTAIARISISVNAKLFPINSLPIIIKPLLHVIKSATHGLFQFEALLALTNIASIDDETRNQIISHGGWGEVRGALGENEKISRAAIECMTNLCLSEKIFERFREGDNDLRLFVLFAQSDDLLTRRAACGALAMLSADPQIASEMHHADALPILKAAVLNTSDDIKIRAKAALDNLAKYPALPAKQPIVKEDEKHTAGIPTKPPPKPARPPPKH